MEHSGTWICFFRMVTLSSCIQVYIVMYALSAAVRVNSKVLNMSLLDIHEGGARETMKKTTDDKYQLFWKDRIGTSANMTRHLVFNCIYLPRVCSCCDTEQGSHHSRYTHSYHITTMITTLIYFLVVLLRHSQQYRYRGLF